jgi:cell division protein FtsI (penicillin-binding protein 3)
MTAVAAHPGTVLIPADRQQLLALTYHRLMMVMLLFAGVTLLIVARLGLLQILSDRSA